MDCALNPKLEKETIYEIYRGCRLCGAGAGYKMPIMQNVLDTEDSELNLPQKIRECVQIEVHPDDKMPPLICELCVDKVNDFYEFLDMCRQTNKRTRLKLGLPLQNAPKEVQESTDCILGDTEPVYINSDSDVEPLAKHKNKPKSKEKSKAQKIMHAMKKELEHNIKLENILSTDRSSRSCRVKYSSPTPSGRVTRTSSGASNEKRRSPTPPPRITRTSVSAEVTTKTQDSSKKSKAPPVVKKEVKSIMKKEKGDKAEDKPLSSLKRSREKEVKAEVPQKKVKLVIEPATPKSRPKPTKPKPSPPPVSTPEVVQTCPVCGQKTRTTIGYHNHMRSHVVCFTNTRLACNACGEWFSTLTEATSHHKWHRDVPYKCRRCTAEFTSPEEYDEHFGNKQCIPFDEVADARCAECWRHFATDRLLIEHHCAGADGRPGGKCPKCNRTYVLLKNLIRHESTCLHRRRSEFNADPQIMEQLRPVQVRVARCDPLLKNIINNHYDVHNVENYGFDENCEYPYSTHIKVKSEPFEGMVKINEEIEKEFLSKDVWDSENSDSEPDKLQSLRALALKNVALKENDEETKDISVINSVVSEVNEKDSDINESTLGVKDNLEINLKENGAEECTEDSKTAAEESSIKEIDTNNTESLERDANIESVSAREIETCSNGIDKEKQDSLDEKLNDVHNGDGKIENGIEKKENDLENGTEAFNNADESEFDSEIDGDKLMAALNAQIGEDDESQNGEKDAAKDNFDEEKHNFVEEKSLDKKKDKLSLDELLAKDKTMDLDTISDEDFNFDV